MIIKRDTVFMASTKFLNTSVMLLNSFKPFILIAILLTFFHHICLSLQPTLDVMVEIVRHSAAPIPDVFITRTFPAVVQCILRSEDYAVLQVGHLYAGVILS